VSGCEPYRGIIEEKLGVGLTAVRIWQDLVEAHGFGLSHQSATHLLEGGADQRFIQQLLGHANADTTALYAQVTITHLQQVHARCHPAERPHPTGGNAAAQAADKPPGEAPGEARSPCNPSFL